MPVPVIVHVILHLTGGCAGARSQAFQPAAACSYRNGDAPTLSARQLRTWLGFEFVLHSIRPGYGAKADQQSSGLEKRGGLCWLSLLRRRPGLTEFPNRRRASGGVGRELECTDPEFLMHAFSICP